MQRGIDTFFHRMPGKKTSEEAATPSPAPKKRKALAISSDEDEVPASPQVSKHGKELKKSRRALETKSPRNDNGYAAKKPSLAKLKDTPKPRQKVNPTELFGGETRRVEAPKPKERSIVEMEDEAIDRSLMEVDLDNPLPAVTISKPSPEPSRKRANASSPKPKTTPKTSTPHVKKVKPSADLESSVLSDEERHERKRMAAVLYQKYKNRSSCLNPGSKEIPKGAPDCLKGLTFLVTGILESMERDEAASVIKEFGGRIMTVVGKKLNYLVVGEEAGPKKLAQAEEHNVSILSEDALFELIRERSGETKSVQVDQSKSPKVKKEEERSSSSKVRKEEERGNNSKVKKEQEQSSNSKVKMEEEKSSSKMKREHEQSSSSKERKERNKEVKSSSSFKQADNSLKVKQERKEKESSVSPKIKQEKLDSAMHVPKMESNNKHVSAISENMAWVDKYKPCSIKEIVGQAGPASNVNKLMNWLAKWYVNHDGKKKPQRPNPWAKNDDGSFYKAALLSGPPGIGKTTTASLVTQELGFDAVEFNASDTRSKRLLKEEVASLLGNKSLYGYANGQSQAVSKKHVLIMDEVDGMAGNEDRGGMQELIALIKDSSIPIICMCNDRNHPKIRSLVNYCYDLRFQRPRLEQIKGRIMSICYKEKLKMPAAKLEGIIAATNNDIRQTINHLALLSAGDQLPESGQQQTVAAKDLKLGPWDVVRKVFTADDHKQMSIYDKCDLFFHDYSMAPLFVQQNYLQVLPQGNRNEILAKVAATADALSLGDLVDKRIRANSAWSLLPTQAVFSSLLPGEYMCGHFTGQINFPGWLGKNSRTNKRSRLAQELHDHTRVCTSASRLSVRLEYAPHLLANIVRPLALQGQEGVPAALAVIKDYHLLREDLESLVELTSWPGKKSPMDAVDGRVKAALTRAYNKEVLAYSYSAQANVKKKRAEAAADDEDNLLGQQDEDGAVVGAIHSSDEDEGKDDLELDGLIKAKKKTAAGAAKKASGATASKAKAKAKK
ncbi:replication factor C subunit 1 [Drosophila grimshawi]|uniref:Replication factor C subunit 1 n=1 Tax=Drosophila grimshawi TaxID=7222 RepID=B4JSV9_DROGR|nr:replication factor C subunit 1 [Drosophila grimshawi]EDV94849.1 GH23049 [Drosophila grimshawi]